ncbi:MAG TPA: patatin-like phospholipase family protein, partial [Burkholderiales bacterium]|nr:patatin-like phospholipase family protein [Burkholderiales bacterium]
MLRALVAHGVMPDLVVGSSVGAINGAYFAGAPTGQGVAQLEAIWRGLRRGDIFPVAWRSILGLLGKRNFLVDPGGLRRVVEECLPYREFEQAAIPLHVVATDLIAGGSVCFSSGPAVDAVLASCAIPAAFPPVRVGERYLIDGAVATNAPISVAVELGAKRAVVLPTGYACALEGPPRDAIGCALHALTLLIAHQLVTETERCREQME